MDRIENELFELCTDFFQLLDALKRTGKISRTEYESHIKFKKLFIHQKEKSKLSI
ncbi:hypothetical protein [Clostridium sp. Cult2]|uniref:hypothetical protein n=1 Tax=Clostridium sp. Cult2 TaxID=2079003 RepID=UPI001F33B732|nr:hypothetical protein [Clostridium sp. Cult2]